MAVGIVPRTAPVSPLYTSFGPCIETKLHANTSCINSEAGWLKAKTNQLAGLPSSTNTEHACLFWHQKPDGIDGQVCQLIETIGMTRQQQHCQRCKNRVHWCIPVSASFWCALLYDWLHIGQGGCPLFFAAISAASVQEPSPAFQAQVAEKSPASKGIEDSCGCPDQIMPSSADDVWGSAKIW